MEGNIRSEEGSEVMAAHVGRIEGLVVVAFILGVASAAPIAESQSSAGQTTQEIVSSNYGAPDGLTGDDVIAKMLERNRFRNEQLQRYSAVRTYEIRNPEGKLAAQALVQVEYRAPDKKTFNKTSEKGSRIVRHLVFDRLLQSESETSSGQQHHDSPTAPPNYTFALASAQEPAPSHRYVT